MDCKTAQSLVIPYINGQLNDEETEEFLEHIENCKECYEELEIHFTVHYALQKLDEDDRVSFNIPKMLKENLKDARELDPQKKDLSCSDRLCCGSGRGFSSPDGHDAAGDVSGEEYRRDQAVSFLLSGWRRNGSDGRRYRDGSGVRNGSDNTGCTA